MDSKIQFTEHDVWHCYIRHIFELDGYRAWIFEQEKPVGMDAGVGI